MKIIKNPKSYSTNILMNNSSKYKTNTSKEEITTSKERFIELKCIVDVNFAKSDFDTDNYKSVERTTTIQISNISSIY